MLGNRNARDTSSTLVELQPSPELATCTAATSHPLAVAAGHSRACATSAPGALPKGRAHCGIQAPTALYSKSFAHELDYGIYSERITQEFGGHTQITQNSTSFRSQPGAT